MGSAVNLSFSFRTPLTFYHLWAHTLESHSLWWAQTGVEGWWSWTDHCWPDLMVSIVKMAVNEHVILSRTSSPSESFSWLINVSINRWSLKRKRLQEKIPWEGEFRPKKRSVSWVNSVLRQFLTNGPSSLNFDYNIPFKKTIIPWKQLCNVRNPRKRSSLVL